MLSLTSLGGAGTVTGSKHLITYGSTRSRSTADFSKD